MVYGSDMNLAYYTGRDQIPNLEDSTWIWENVKVRKSEKSLFITPLGNKFAIRVMLFRNCPNRKNCNEFLTKHFDRAHDVECNLFDLLKESLQIKILKSDIVIVCSTTWILKTDLCNIARSYFKERHITSQNKLYNDKCAIFSQKEEPLEESDTMIEEIPGETFHPTAKINKKDMFYEEPDDDDDEGGDAKYIFDRTSSLFSLSFKELEEMDKLLNSDDGDLYDIRDNIEESNYNIDKHEIEPPLSRDDN